MPWLGSRTAPRSALWAWSVSLTQPQAPATLLTLQFSQLKELTDTIEAENSESNSK